MEYTLKYVKDESGQYVGFLAEIPGVCSQANSLDELKVNIKDALGAMLSVMREVQENEPVLVGWEHAKAINIEL